MAQTLDDRAEGAPAGFARNVYKLATGTSVAQLLPVLAAPLLTRLYSPADIGFLAGFVAAAVLAATAATGRYAVAVVLPADDEDAAHLALLAAALCAGLSSLGLAVLLLFRRQIAGLLGGALPPGLPYLIALAVLLLGLFECLQYWMTRRRRFGILAGAFAAQAVATVGVQVAYGFGGGGSRGLLTGYLAGLLLATALLAASAATDRGHVAGVSRSRLRALAAGYAQFPKFDLPNAFVHSLGNQGVVLALAGIFGAQAIGFYALAERVLIIPFRFFTQSFSQVFYQRLAEEYQQDRARFVRSIQTSLWKIIQLLTVPVLAAVLLSRYLVAPVFGAEWRELHVYIVILAPFVYVTLLVTPLAYVLKIVHRQQVSLRLSSVLFLAKLSALAAGGMAFGMSVTGTLNLLVAAAVGGICFNVAVVLRQARVRAPTAVWVAFGASLLWVLAVAVFAL